MRTVAKTMSSTRIALSIATMSVAVSISLSQAVATDLDCGDIACERQDGAAAAFDLFKVADADPHVPIADAHGYYVGQGAASETDSVAPSRLFSVYGGDDEGPVALEFRVIEFPVADFLRLMAGKAGFRLRVSSGVQDKIRDTYYRGSGREILESIAHQHDLDWFEFNGIVYVSAVRDAITRIIPLDDIDIGRARRALVESGLIMDAMRVSDAADGTALSVYGAPEFVGIAEAIIEVTPPLDAITPHRMAVRVRKGVDTAMEYYGDAGRREENQTVTLKNVTERVLSAGSRNSDQTSDRDQTQVDD